MKKIVSLFILAGFLLAGMSCEKTGKDDQKSEPNKPEDLYADLSVSGLTPKGCAKKGAEITFALDNLKGGPVTYSWTFPGGTPATSTEESPKVVWNDQINDVEVSVVITSEADGSTLTLKQNIIAGKIHFPEQPDQVIQMTVNVAHGDDPLSGCCLYLLNCCPHFSFSSNHRSAIYTNAAVPRYNTESL